MDEGKLKQPNPEKVEAIQKISRQETKRQLRSFLGLVSFYRKFVPHFSAIALPLRDLTKKGAPNKINWEKPQENAFNSLKCILIHSSVLRLPDNSRPFILQRDASNGGIGVVL